jgi:hypothetical protein
MTQKQNGIPYEQQPSGIGAHDEPTTGPTGPQPKRSQPMSQNSLITFDSPDDVETRAESNAEIQRP